METFHSIDDCIDYIKDHYELMVNGEYTMAGLIVHYLPLLRANWCDSTTVSSLTLYIRHILPHINDKPLNDYNVDYFKESWDEIRRKGPLDNTNQNRSIPKPYSPEYMGRIRFLMRHVVLIGAVYHKCSDFLYGSDFAKPQYGFPKDYVEKNKKRLAKSFSALMEYMISSEIFSDPTQAGEKMLLLNMYLAAVRNTEAASIPWNCLRKVDTYPNISALWIEYSKEGRSLYNKSGSKSSNVYRFSVLSDKAANFYEARKEHIIDQVQSGAYRGSVADVETWPIGCHGKNWDQPCTSQQVTAAAADLFKTIGLSEEDLAYLELEMEYFEDRHYKTINLTAYVFRRACATRYYHLGMDPDECLYLLGHAFGSKEKRNELSNPDRLKKMYDKIIMHPIVGDLDLNDMTIVMEGSHLDVVLLRDQDVVIPCRGQNIEIVYIPYENAADGSIVLKVIDDSGDCISIPFYYKYKKSELSSNPKLYLRSEYLDLYREGLEAYQKLLEKAAGQ